MSVYLPTAASVHVTSHLRMSMASVSVTVTKDPSAAVTRKDAATSPQLTFGRCAISYFIDTKWNSNNKLKKKKYSASSITLIALCFQLRFKR